MFAKINSGCFGFSVLLNEKKDRFGFEIFSWVTYFFAVILV
jgi:hypothetical protein